MTGPDSKYMMQWGGAWRPVVNMFDYSNAPTTLALRAAKAVLYVSDTCWIVCLVSPGDIVERPDRDPSEREWEYIN